MRQENIQKIDALIRSQLEENLELVAQLLGIDTFLHNSDTCEVLVCKYGLFGVNIDLGNYTLTVDNPLNFNYSLLNGCHCFFVCWAPSESFLLNGWVYEITNVNAKLGADSSMISMNYIHACEDFKRLFNQV